MNHKFTDSFNKNAYVGETIETEADSLGYFFRATIEQDIFMGTPWEEDDGHGIISDWRRKESKEPGERILCTDGSRARFYNVQESTQIAKRDGWGCRIETHEHKTKGEQVACAVTRDFERLRAWCNDEWFWAGVILSLHRQTADGEEVINKHCASLWGIDGSDQGEYLTEVANDLIKEAQEHDDIKSLWDIAKVFEDVEGVSVTLDPENDGEDDGEAFFSVFADIEGGTSFEIAGRIGYKELAETFAQAVTAKYLKH